MLRKRYSELIRSYAKNIMFVVFGIFSAAVGLKSFLLPNKFLDGGATGIALLIAEITAFPLSLLLVLINIPFVFIGYKTMGARFAVKTALAIGGLAIVTAFVPFPAITHDKLLVAVFGGFFLGAGVGLTIRGGAVLDGTEVLAIALSKKLGTTIGDIIIIINVIVFSSAAYFFTIETALYSVITYLAATKIIDFTIDGIEEYTGITIISVRSDDVRTMIINELGRGVTVYTGRGGYGNHGETKEMDIIYTVITRLEVSKINSEIEKIDPSAFVVMSSIKDTKGGMIKRRPFKH
ncbi:MAG: YitT family protein [Ignavibacteriae bacterium]|nr:YitT family protein [Ignavibacteriota bacterium]